MKEINGIVFYRFNEVCVLIGINPSDTETSFLRKFKTFYYVKEILLFREYIPQNAFTDNVLVDGMVREATHNFNALFDNNIRRNNTWYGFPEGKYEVGSKLR